MSNPKPGNWFFSRHPVLKCFSIPAAGHDRWKYCFQNGFRELYFQPQKPLKNRDFTTLTSDFAAPSNFHPLI